MTKIETRKDWLIKCFVAFLLSYGVFFVKYPQYILNANNETFIPNGDPLVTIYDMVYHVRHDNSTTFEGMNYPQGEYIFMTDALGSFATVFRWVDNYIYDIDPYISGIVFSLIFLLIGLCGTFIFMILRTSGVTTIVALALSPLITLLSPQMVRIIGHLSLSFPFVIPMVMLWLLRKYKIPRIEIWDAVFALVTFFFFMNNAYVGFIMCMFAGVTGFILFLKSLKQVEYRKSSIVMMSTPVIITLIVFVLLKVNDPYNDRLEEQWGFFYYHTRWHSFFYPKYSLVASWIPEFQNGDKRSIEWTNNLGLVPIFMIVSLGIYSLRSKIMKTGKRLVPKDKMMSCFLWAAFLMFLYAANTTIFPIKDLIESKMDILLMFKASGRFSWPMYFVVALFSAKIIQSWVNKLEEKKAYLSLIMIPIFLFYGFETNHYLDQRFTNKSSANYLTSPESDVTAKMLEDAEINKDNYQAMILLPLFVGWNEKMKIGVFNLTEKGGLSVSAITGIPMINGRLSRNSTSKTLQAVQIASNSLIKKEVLDLMPNNKPILLIQGKNSDDRLTQSELDIRSLATKVFEADDYVGYKVSLDAIDAYHQKMKQEATERYDMSKDSLTSPLYIDHFDDKKTPVSLFGQGAFLSKKGKQKILDLKQNFNTEDTLRMTIWSEITHKKYGMPEYILTVKGPEKHYYKNVIFSRIHKEIYKNWIRSEVLFPVPKGENHIELVMRGNQPFYLDELQLSYARDTIYHDLGSNGFLINNIPVITSK